MAEVLKLQHGTTERTKVNCLVYLISPTHAISACAALISLHKKNSSQATILVHWPGVHDAMVQELAAIIREMVSFFPFIGRVVSLSSMQKDELLLGFNIPSATQFLREKLGNENYDEIYYAHDIEGGMQQFLCASFPSAKRICFGDALGNVYEKKVHLSYYGVPSGRTTGMVSALRNTAAKVKNLLKVLASDCKQERACGRGEQFAFEAFLPHEAALTIPVDQSGNFLRDIPLTVCKKETVLDVVERCAASCHELQAYIGGLLGHYQGRGKFLLLTENHAEGNFIDFHREAEMYCAVIRKQCEPGSVIFLKSHPGETLPRNERISARLADDYEVVTLEPKFKRYPIELWRDLISSSTTICMSYPVLSFKYLYDIDVIQPMDDAFIERWFPEWTWASYKNAVMLYMEPLKKLETWDGNSVLWSGSENIQGVVHG